ncbi:hypothetical protein C1646_728911 [Rhizophagus diaphanus]|nr:hypothetical protein C1646_728911 [Rhizophagus diaphanus] [Rhizophagus sp. MUCL 43196]
MNYISNLDERCTEALIWNFHSLCSFYFVISSALLIRKYILTSSQCSFTKRSHNPDTSRLSFVSLLMQIKIKLYRKPIRVNKIV